MNEMIEIVNLLLLNELATMMNQMSSMGTVNERIHVLFFSFNLLNICLVFGYMKIMSLLLYPVSYPIVEYTVKLWIC